MGIKRHKLYCFLIIVLFLPNTRGSCQATELQKENNLCTASLQCDQVISFQKSTWPCIQRIEEVYDRNYYYRGPRTKTTYDSDFNLFVNLKNVDDQTYIFESDEIILYIKKLHVDDGNWLSIPHDIYRLSEATELEISNNQISDVNLNKFVSMLNLRMIILRNNSISTIHTYLLQSVGSRSIQSIDLSWNVLEKLPNSCFSLFTDLQHLNLSHNMINNFDILTFEGVMGLITLDVSHNKLLEIENSFTRFINLQDLYLQNNKLSKLVDYNFSKLTKLKKFNISFNNIDTIENNTFKSLILLEYLDLRNNKIEAITRNLFEHNENLQYLFLSNNNINHIDDGAFEGKNIIKFDIKDNVLAGNIGKDNLKGIHVTNLDITHGSITSLGNETFKYMCQDLNNFNISFNNLSYISETAFACLEQLTVLDLSHNILNDLNFETSDLKNLTHLHVHHNKIEKIPSLSNLISLKYIDLSYNEIREIELQSFLGLENMETLSITHNPFVISLANNTFDGMVALQSIDLSNTRSTSYENRSFSGLSSLKQINASSGQLNNLAYNALIDTGSIVSLDFSNNLLSIFHINTSSIPKIEEINLNHNLIRFISKNTFSGLKELRKLSLIYNSIQRMEAALKDSPKLTHIFLSSNRQMEIIGNPFDNLTNLYQVNMDEILTNYTFQNNTSIDNLDLHSCGIKDLNRISIFKVSDLSELNLSNNKIEKIDKFSLQSLPFLVKLDLSSNLISFIQPGSFLQVGRLRTLTLFGNNLETLQFGVFDGMTALNFVNLSSNALQSFDVKLLPVALSIGLDNNYISDLNFGDFFQSSITKLSIGANQFSCKVLAELKISNYSQKFKEVLTTAIPDFHSENVDGISCQSVPEHGKVILPVANFTAYDVRPVITKFTNAIENLHSLIKNLDNNSANDKSNQNKLDITELLKSIEALVDISNRTQIKSDSYFKNLEYITNTTQSHLETINNQLINFTEKKNYMSPDYNMTGDVKSNVNSDEIRLEMKKMLKEEIDAIREEFGKTFQNIQKPKSEPAVFLKETGDDKVLYFIAASLGILIVLYVVNIVYGYFKRERRVNGFHSSSRRPITSEMELE